MTPPTPPTVADAAYDLAQLRRACQAHGLAAAEIEPLPQLGISNVLYLVDGKYCLRLPGPMGWARWSIHIEAIGVPLAAAAGVAAPGRADLAGGGGRGLGRAEGHGPRRRPPG